MEKGINSACQQVGIKRVLQLAASSTRLSFRPETVCGTAQCVWAESKRAA